MSRNVEMRFVSRRFVIEYANLWLYRLQLDREPKTLSTTTGHSLELTPSSPNQRDVEDFESDFATLEVRNGSVNAPIDHAGLVEGMLLGIRTRRLSGATASHAFAEFTHQVTEADWSSGVTIINMDAYREVVINVRDGEGRPSGGGRIGLARATKEGGIDVSVDEHGEVRLLLLPGTYKTTGVRFEIPKSDAQDIVEITVRPRTQNPPEPDH